MEKQTDNESTKIAELLSQLTPTNQALILNSVSALLFAQENMKANTDKGPT